MRITENELNKILSEENSGISEELLTYLKRHYPVYSEDSLLGQPIKMIKIGDKVRPLFNNKKYLVDKIFSLEQDQWLSLGIPKTRRTIKYYLDGIK